MCELDFVKLRHTASPCTACERKHMLWVDRAPGSDQSHCEVCLHSWRDGRRAFVE